MKKLFLILYIFLFNFFHSQICGTDEYNKPFIESNPEKYSQIEKDIQNYLKGAKLKSNHKIVIPVVFHVVWQDNNENIPDSVLYHQLEVLNESFNARNADTTLLTDTLKRWVGNFDINFELAYLDPNGLPTSGITRTHTQVPAFSYFGNLVKFDEHGKSPWPTDRYLNIWVCDLYNLLLGYAQFPGGPKDTDGIVLDWQITGNQIYPWTYTDLLEWAGGRVAVHEVGHWLNLFHPWGNDGTCSNDHIPETGLQNGPIYPSAMCPDTMIGTCNPPERFFIKHYMDYSGNNCMVCFTKNQVLRGLASLNTYRNFMVESYQPRPTINKFEDTKINPTLTKGRLYIELPPYDGEVEIKIYDAQGRVVKYMITNKRFNEIYLNSPPGFYLINIYFNQEKIFGKKIIIHPSSLYGAQKQLPKNNLTY